MTPSQREALEYAAKFGGRIPLMTRANTTMALYSRHWIDENDRITIVGRQALDAERAKDAVPR
jgi:hypothetical protein